MLKGVFAALVLALAQSFTIPAVLATAPPAIDGNAEGAAWKSGARVTLDHEIAYRKGIGGDRTDVYVLVDKKYLYVAWVCKQNEPVVAQQLSNDAGMGGDDFVTLTLWPAGSEGVTYSFAVTPTGAHSESSTENTAFAPNWKSAARRTPQGYDVTMRIPRDVLRTAGGNDWRVQFARKVAQSNLRLVWAYDADMQYASDPLYAGTLAGIGKIAPPTAARPRTRVQVYGLGEIASLPAGGNTSRTGIDYSIPVSRGSSFYGTIHPDYSEVEIDQQSISPTEFQRFYREVRPFFTQGANYFNQSGLTDLYTPSIPTPRYGYAFEGANNGLHYAAFNAIGDARNDNAQAVSYTTADHRFAAAYQRTAVGMPGFFDDTQSASISAGNGKHFGAYTIFGWDEGARVLDPARNRYRNLGANLYSPNESVGMNLISNDEFYNPYDGYFTNVDIHGYNAYVNKTWPFGAKAKLQSLSIYGYIDRYHDHAGTLNQSDSSLNVSLSNRRNSGAYLNLSSAYLLVPPYGMVPFNQPGIGLYDNANPARSFGASYNAGHFMNGFERAYSSSVWFQTGRRSGVSLAINQNVYSAPFLAHSAVLNLDSLSWSYQFGPDASLAASARLIDGEDAGFTPQPWGRYTNLSFAFNERFHGAHLYAVYGDPNAFTTAPTFIVKIVRFLGGDEGT